MANLPIRRVVIESIAELTSHPVHGIEDSDDLTEDFAIDSRMAVTLIMRIEDKLGMELPDGSDGIVANARTVGELVSAVATAFALNRSAAI